MNKNVEEYLNLTRGKNNFKESDDEVIKSLISKMHTVLEKHRINVVVISSEVSKNEVITNFDNSITIIWDTNYWVYCAYYFDNLINLNLHIKNKTDLEKIQCDVLWRDLFKVIINRNIGTVEQKMFFVKYYLSYGKRSFFFQGDEISNYILNHTRISNIANAKMYVFFHELAHITAAQDVNYYIGVLTRAFSDDIKNSLYKYIIDDDDNFNDEEKSCFRDKLDNMVYNLHNGKYDVFEEIICDMRAMHSLITNCMILYPDDLPNIILLFKDGISLARSFNLRIRHVEKALKEINCSNDYSKFRGKVFNSQFGKDFYIRDKLAEFLQTFIMIDCLGQKCNKTFIEQYETQTIIDNETVRMIDSEIAYHIANVGKEFNDEIKRFQDFSHENVLNILRCFMYSQKEESDSDLVNLPVKNFGFTGLLF